MSNRLTDTQLVLLSAAAQREDRLLSPPSGARLAQAKKAAAKLVQLGLVREVNAKKESPVWRRDVETGQAYALKLTAAGTKAIPVEDAGENVSAAGPEPEAAGRCKLSSAGTKEEPSAGELSGPSADRASAPSVSPRAGSKIAGVIALLARDTGAAISELVAATGWLPHTTRAALTGLRKRGFSITTDRSDKARGAVYRVDASAAYKGTAALADLAAVAPEPAPAEASETSPADGVAPDRRPRMPRVRRSA